MIVQEFYIPKYGDWHVKVYYAVHTYWADRIIMDLYRIGCRGDSLKRAYRNLTEGRMNTGLTYSDYRRRETVMVISLTSTPESLGDMPAQMTFFVIPRKRSFVPAYLQGFRD